MSISQKRLEEILNIPDDEIDTSDIPELDDRFWENARMVTPITKKAVSIRLDSDVLDWFKVTDQVKKKELDKKRITAK